MLKQYRGYISKRTKTKNKWKQSHMKIEANLHCAENECVKIYFLYSSTQTAFYIVVIVHSICYSELTFCLESVAALACVGV